MESLDQTSIGSRQVLYLGDAPGKKYPTYCTFLSWLPGFFEKRVRKARCFGGVTG